MWALLFFFLEIANDLMFQVFCMTDSDCNKALVTVSLPYCLGFGPVDTQMRFQKYAFSLSSKTNRSSRVHTTALMLFHLSTIKLSKTIQLHVVT